MDIKELNNRASNKAFAKITMLRMDIDKLKDDLRRQMYGGVTRHEVELCLEGTKKELDTWSYIYKLIETENFENKKNTK